MPRAVFEAIGQSRLKERVRPGGSVAITVGSRGIAGISDLVRAAVDGGEGRGTGAIPAGGHG